MDYRPDDQPFLTQAKLRAIVEYDPITGIFKRNGEPFGTDNGSGYLRGTIGNRQHYLHRLVWLYLYGVAPRGNIDHIDGDRKNNSLSNLRHVTHADNQRNMRRSSNNTSGFTGVSWNSRRKQWVAYIKEDSKHVHLGWFKTRGEAIDARKAANIKFGYHPNHGRAA